VILNFHEDRDNQKKRAEQNERHGADEHIERALGGIRSGGEQPRPQALLKNMKPEKEPAQRSLSGVVTPEH